MTGITLEKGLHANIPRDNYELKLEAQRMAGADFFCGLTFPVRDRFCTLILGGWHGTVTGLSNLDDFDASENSSTTFLEYENERWYAVRLRVARDTITVWLDNEQIIEETITNRVVTIRPEVEPSRPLGIASYASQSALRNIAWRSVEP